MTPTDPSADGAPTEPPDDARGEEGRTDPTGRTNPYPYVALFSIPPGIGMTGFVASATGETLSTVALATGLVTTLAIAGFVLLAFRTGEGAA